MKHRVIKTIEIGSPEWETLMTRYLEERKHRTPDLKKALEKLGFRVE